MASWPLREGSKMGTGQVIGIGIGVALVVGVVVYAATRPDTAIATTNTVPTEERPTDAAAEAARGISNVAREIAVAVRERNEAERERRERLERQAREDALHERERREAREDRTIR